MAWWNGKHKWESPWKVAKKPEPDTPDTSKELDNDKMELVDNGGESKGIWINPTDQLKQEYQSLASQQLDSQKLQNGYSWVNKDWVTYNVSYNTAPSSFHWGTSSVYPDPYQSLNTVSIKAELDSLKDRLIKSLSAKGNEKYRELIKSVVSNEIEITTQQLKGT